MRARHPKERVLKDLVGEALLALALMGGVERKHHEQAARTIDEFSQLVSADLAAVSTGGRRFSRNVWKSRTSAARNEAGEKVMKAYGDRAIAMLAAAVKAGWSKKPPFSATIRYCSPCASGRSIARAWRNCKKTWNANHGSEPRKLRGSARRPRNQFFSIFSSGAFFSPGIGSAAVLAGPPLPAAPATARSAEPETSTEFAFRALR